MDKPLLIVGIDPGTTVGYAVLDLGGKVIDVGSSKEVGMSSLISKIVGIGKVVVVGCDKKKVPAFVEGFAIRVGARIIGPNKDLSIKDKKDLTRKYKTENSHEADALASALFAFKELRPLLKKLELFIQRNKKRVIGDKIKELVIKEGISIKLATDLIEKPEKEGITIVKKVIEERKLEKKDFIRLYDKYKQLEKENRLLREHSNKLEGELKNIKEKYDYLKKKIEQLKTDEKTEEHLRFKEERLVAQYQQIKAMKDEIDGLNREIGKIRGLLANIGKNVLLKKLRNLGSEEFERKNRILNIQEGDIILVEEPNIISKKVIDYLKPKVQIIVYKKDISKKLQQELSFIFIESKRLKIEEDKYFAIVSRQSLEKEKNNINLLKRIVEDYKKGRG
jgi:hypothetical protein